MYEQSANFINVQAISTYLSYTRYKHDRAARERERERESERRIFWRV